MKRDTLKRFLRGLVFASLSSCCRDYPSEFNSSLIDGAALQSVDGGVQENSPLPPELCREACGSAVYCFVQNLDAGSPRVMCQSRAGAHQCGAFLAGGRPPAGLRRAKLIECADPLGTYFAGIAHVEQAAVLGFSQLAEELERLGAPPALLVAARAAAADETRHAKIARRLARDHGAAPPAVEIDTVPPRDAFQIAMENAIEGQVFETFAALTTLWQAHQAQDRRVRAAFTVIARDELRHAELAARVGRWIEPRLPAEQQAQVAAARRAAAARLAQKIEEPQPDRLSTVAGMPSTEVMRPWVAEMTRRLWS